MIVRDEAYLLHLRSEPCIITGLRATEFESVVAAHIGTAGKGIKNSDDWALPVADHIHKVMHSAGEITTLREWAPDYIIRAAFQALAREYYREWKRSREEREESHIG